MSITRLNTITLAPELEEQFSDINWKADPSTWSNIAKVVFRRTYLREDGGRTETFEEAVERVIRGNVRLVDPKDLDPNEIERLAYFMLNRKASPAGRGWWFSGSPSNVKIGGAALNNCFRGDTKFLTLNGETKSLKESVGQELPVLCSDGVFRPGTVRNFGAQPLNRVRFGIPGRSKVAFEYDVTQNHRWITQRGEVTDLRVGDKVTVAPREADVGSSEFQSGFIHGVFFGDGTMHPQYQTRFMILLCGKKQAYLSDIEKHSGFVSVARHPSSDFEPIATVISSENLKEVPKNKSTNYQAGFLAGWMATDGSSRGRLCSTDHEALDWLVERAPLLGFCVVGDSIDPSEETNYGSRSRKVRVLTLSSQQTTYSVKAIESLDIDEEVFCVTEPVTGSFTLAGGIPTGNCWFTTGEHWENLVLGMDLLMLGGGVGISIEHRYVSKLPRVKKAVRVEHRATKDADFIVPDSREGWCELVRRAFEAFFVTGKSFTYSTVCVRGYGEGIAGFGGKASGPLPLIACVEKIAALLISREGHHVRPLDVMDMFCIIGEMVVAGNVRRSAIIILGDAHDKEYLKSKRWDLGSVPTQRAMANLSVVVDDVDDLHPLFWKTYESGEPFGIINRKNIRKFGRMGELKKDTAMGMNPCAEATLEDGEPCNLQEIFLANIKDEAEFIEAARLMHRYGKRVTLEDYHNPKNNEVVKRNRRIGTGITGCLQSPLFKPEFLDKAYSAIQAENVAYSKRLGIPESIRTTVVKPSGTMSIWGDCTPGIHPSYSRYYVRRVRFSSSDPLVKLLAEAGHPMEPVQRFDGTLDHATMVVDFFMRTPDGTPCSDDGFDTWSQLEALVMAQKHWADQAVSVTVYYKREELLAIKSWLADNLPKLKSISFLCHSEHGFKQAPLEAITKEVYEKMSAKIKPVNLEEIKSGALESLECEGGVCPIK